MVRRISRRESLGWMSAAALSPFLSGCVSRVPVLSSWQQYRTSPEPKRVAAICTIWQKGLHAEVLAGKILEGWDSLGGPGPNLKLTSMYIDQIGPHDSGIDAAKKHGVQVFDTIEGAISVGGQGMPIDGVLLIGEHGEYPANEKGQDLYPRRRFMEEITDAFVKYGKVVPIYNDKHLGPEWLDALWMYNRAKELNIPFMAGSSLPLAYRVPDLTLPLGCEVEAVVCVGYSELDRYGIHALEFLQTLLERRRNAEKGVRRVQAWGLENAWAPLKRGDVDEELLDVALQASSERPPAEARENDNEWVGTMWYEYNDGLKVSIFMQHGHARRTAVAVRLKGESQPRVTTGLEMFQPARVPHFAYLLHAVERMFHTGVPTYPVERTLLTTGILDRALTSIYEGEREVITPELTIAYEPVDYPHAPNPLIETIGDLSYREGVIAGS